MRQHNDTFPLSIASNVPSVVLTDEATMRWEIETFNFQVECYKSEVEARRNWQSEEADTLHTVDENPASDEM